MAVMAQSKPDFARDVEPLLKRRCQMCHNARLKSNGLRLDDGQAALEGGYSGPVIVPGKGYPAVNIRLYEQKPVQPDWLLERS